MKKQLIFGFTIGLISGLIYFNSSIKIKYINSGNIIYSYNIKINKFMKKFTVIEKNNCTNNECSSINKKTVVLTNKEYNKIKKVVNKKDFDIAKLSTALSDITKNNKTKYTIENIEYDMNEDLNADGKITYKESGTYNINQLSE